MKRAVLRAVCRIIIGILVAAQLSVAAYACAGLSMARPGTQVDLVGVMMAVAGDTTPVAGMAALLCCQDAETAGESINSNLCHAHCRFGQQGDQASTVSVPAATLLLLPGLPWQWSGAISASPPLPSPRAAAARLGGIVAAAPCHAILHCVRRT